MKTIRLITVVLLSISFGLLNAQNYQGKVLLGLSSSLNLSESGSDLMNVGFSTVHYKSNADDYDEPPADKLTNINFLPKVGYFVDDRFVLGLDLSVGYSKNKDNEFDYTYSQTMYSVGPFVRYYIPTAKVLPFLEINGSFGNINSKENYQTENNIYEDDEWNTGLFSFGGGLGLAAPLGEKVNFDVLAGYNYFRFKAKEDNENNYRSEIGTLGLKIGFTVLLGSN